jgi:hypothetical protein
MVWLEQQDDPVRKQAFVLASLSEVPSVWVLDRAADMIWETIETGSIGGIEDSLVIVLKACGSEQPIRIGSDVKEIPRRSEVTNPRNTPRLSVHSDHLVHRRLL